MKILAVTGSRADWGLLFPVLTRLRDDARFDLILVITGQHLETEAEESLAEIERAGFETTHRVDLGLRQSDDRTTVSDAMGRATSGLGAIFAKSSPDIVLLLGDRYETLGAASAALVHRLPVVHLCGGDITEGAMDDAIRHAITKLSAVHCVTTEEAARRVRQLGELPLHVHNTGSPGLDHIRDMSLVPPNELWTELRLMPSKYSFLITLHPATLSKDVAGPCDALIAALETFPEASFIVTGSNADPGARLIDKKMLKFVADQPNATFRKSLGSKHYFSALAAVDVVIGNSSSGLYEAPSFDVFTVNIGDRQARRARATSVIDCADDTASIKAAISLALTSSANGTVNPYGDGQAASRIIEILAAIDDPSKLIRKSFVDVVQ